ncbi:MAG: hypothetical protein Ct9H300mP4_09320 [Gammaproteobacteria bacterium]|nr:MAG: hypothetical protein Ct9H300mP4_09320 [Gammaproteobacteria bacterium]
MLAAGTDGFQNRKNTRLSFMEKDPEGKSHWFDLVKGQWIQGLIA